MNYKKQLLVSTLTIVLILISTDSVDGAATIFNPYAKCKTTTTAERIIELCYAEVTGKTVDPATITEADVSPKEKEDTIYCSFKKNGIIGLDGKTVNVRKANNNIDSMEAEQAVKDQLKEGVQKCADKGGEGIDFVRCNFELITKVCKN